MARIILSLRARLVGDFGLVPAVNHFQIYGWAKPLRDEQTRPAGERELR